MTSTDSSTVAATPTEHSFGSVWQDLRDAIAGKEHDYTQGSIRRSIFLLAVPMVLEMVMESLFAVSDVFFVSRVGAAAVATVGLTESLMIVIYTLAMGLAISATAVVARRIGEKDSDGAARAAFQAIALGLVISGTIAAIGAVFAPQLLRAMHAGPDVLASGTSFARVMLGGSVTAFMLFVINAVFRGAGDAAVAMRVLWLANGINIVLGPMLIFGVGPFPEMGVTGAAVATTIGRGIGVIFALSRLMKGSGHLALKRKHLAIEFQTMISMLRMSVTSTFQVLVGSLSWILLIALMATFGSVAMAGYTIAIRLLIFFLMPAAGLGNAAATMVGQSLGANDPDRAEQAVWAATRYNMWFLGLMGLLSFIFAPWIISAFTNDAEVAHVAVRGLRIMCAGFPLYALGMSLEQAFNGAGDVKTPTWINIIVFWLFEIPLAWVLGEHTHWAWQSIFISVFAAYSLLSVLSLVVFRRGSWKTQKV
ncbi:MAG: MATE family efflux transporter [Gemmatimonadaceae bacterium]